MCRLIGHAAWISRRSYKKARAARSPGMHSQGSCVVWRRQAGTLIISGLCSAGTVWRWQQVMRQQPWHAFVLVVVVVLYVGVLAFHIRARVATPHHTSSIHHPVGTWTAYALMGTHVFGDGFFRLFQPVPPSTYAATALGFPPQPATASRATPPPPVQRPFVNMQ